MEGEGEGQLRVVWTPPFSLPGEPISYSLLVRDETSGDHTTVGPLSDTSYTHTHYQRYRHSTAISTHSLSSLSMMSVSLPTPPPLLLHYIQQVSTIILLYIVTPLLLCCHIQLNCYNNSYTSTLLNLSVKL